MPSSVRSERLNLKPVVRIRLAEYCGNALEHGKRMDFIVSIFQSAKDRWHARNSCEFLGYFGTFELG